MPVVPPPARPINRRTSNEVPPLREWQKRIMRGYVKSNRGPIGPIRTLLSDAHSVRTYLDNWQNGGVLGKISTAAHAVDSLIGVVSGLSDSSQWLEAFGATRVPLSYAQISEVMQSIGATSETYQTGDSESMAIMLWPEHGIVAFRPRYNSWNEARIGITGDARNLDDLMREHLWRSGNRQRMTSGEHDETERFEPLEQPGHYVGNPSPAELGNALLRDRPYTAMLIGPSGCGKTTYVLRALDTLPPDTRAMFVMGSNFNEKTVQSVARYRPDVLIIDDLEMNNLRWGSMGHVEAARRYCRAVLLTFMTDRPAEEYLQDGGMYWPGMRPGRIDRIILLTRPDAEQRAAILRDYMPATPPEILAEMAEATGGMTGAYLKALADEIKWRGIEARHEIIQLLRYQMPVT